MLDCFVAEPVIGPATSGRIRWLLAMTNTANWAASHFAATGATRSLWFTRSKKRRAGRRQTAQRLRKAGG
jgi:hypothetical protein